MVWDLWVCLEYLWVCADTQALMWRWSLVTWQSWASSPSRQAEMLARAACEPVSVYVCLHHRWGLFESLS